MKKRVFKKANTKQADSTPLKELIKELTIGKEDTIFLHKIGGKTESKKVSELSDKELKYEITKVMPGIGGTKHDYSCYMFFY